MSADKYRPSPRAFQAAVRPYIRAGMTVIPLGRWNAPEGKGKRPRDDGWPDTAYDSAAVVAEAIANGNNVGARPGPEFVIADTDPRNFGDVSFVAFCAEHGLDPDTLPAVLTGGGGVHYFARLPKGTGKLRKKLRGYPGIDFLSGDAVQVVCAGAKHPSGKLYEWDEFNGRPALEDAPELPPHIVKVLEKPTVERMESDAPDVDAVSPEVIAEALAQLDPTDFQDHDDWLTLMMATAAASGGNACEEFVEWSTSDPEYADAGDDIRHRWGTIEPDGEISGGTFWFICKEHGVGRKTLDKISAGHRAERTTAAEDFADDLSRKFTLEPMRWNMRDLPKILTFADKCLTRAADKTPLYQMHGRLVMPFRLPEKQESDGLKRAAGSLMLEPVSPKLLHLRMIDHVPLVKGKLEKSDDNEKGEVVIEPMAAPLTLANYLLADRDKWSFPVLTGIIEAPTLRKDGTLLTAQGYDAQSGLYLDLKGFRFPAIPDEPSKADALAALEVLKAPFAEFPFLPDDPDARNIKAKSASRSVMLSAILTGLIRRNLKAAPLHALSATAPGAGKSKLADGIAQIIIGRSPTKITFEKSESENEKRLFAALLTNDPVILYDNVTEPLEGNALCTALTEPTWDNRFLGESRMVKVNTDTLQMATGNNIRLKGDARRRAVMCTIDPRTENPEERTFSIGDLDGHIKKHRGELVAAGLTILRAFFVAGCPQQPGMKQFGSYEEWSRIVRGALLWLSQPDPHDTVQDIKDDDPETQEIAQLMAAMRSTFGDSFRSASEIIAAAHGDDVSNLILESAVRGLGKTGDDARMFGAYLKQRAGRIIGPLRLQGHLDKKAKIYLYRVEDMTFEGTEFG